MFLFMWHIAALHVCASVCVRVCVCVLPQNGKYRYLIRCIYSDFRQFPGIVPLLSSTERDI